MVKIRIFEENCRPKAANFLGVEKFLGFGKTNKKTLVASILLGKGETFRASIVTTKFH